MSSGEEQSQTEEAGSGFAEGQAAIRTSTHLNSGSGRSSNAKSAVSQVPTGFQALQHSPMDEVAPQRTIPQWVVGSDSPANLDGSAILPRYGAFCLGGI
jgi:hypothetical protein